MTARRSDYVIVDDGAGTRAYRVPNTGASLAPHDRRKPDGHDRQTSDNHHRRSLDGPDRRSLDGPERREQIRRALDRMQATPAEISRIAAAAISDAR